MKSLNRKDQSDISSIETRICRICWNTNGWVKPSGRIGKSKSSAKSHEKDFGFGHEEWLFDMDKIYNGYHYGFLEPVRKFQTKYALKTFNFLLYTVNGRTLQRYWIGNLKEVEVLSKELAEKAIEYYRKNGWLQEMRNDLERVGLDGNRMTNKYLSELDIINIRFRPEEIANIFEQPILVDSSDKRITANRYVLLNVEKGQEKLFDTKEIKVYSFESGNDGENKNKANVSKSFTQKAVEHEARHNKMSDSFLAYLKNTYGFENVKRECRAYENSRIDIVRKSNVGDVFYEIKTYNFLETSMRVAIGQLFEYCFYPETKNAAKLYLVSHISPDENFIKYLNQLNKFIKISLGYIQFDVEKNEIVKIIN